MAKQYLLLMEEDDIVSFKKVVPSAFFLEVQGMDIAGNPMIKILTTPLYTPVVTAPQFVAETTEQPQAVNE